MLSPVSSVRFCANQAPASAVNPLERPGAFTKPQEQEAPAKKKSGVGKKILKTVGALAVVAAALVGLQKGGVVKVLDPAAKATAGFMQKVGHYVATAGEFLGKYSYDLVANLFKKP